VTKATKIKTRKWDLAEHIKTEEDVVAYLDAALDDGDPELVTAVLGDIARSKGMAKIAKKTGLGRESLYKALSKNGNPKLETFLKVVQALGLKLKVAA
jgi:probable addiction module antidote protein